MLSHVTLALSCLEDYLNTTHWLRAAIYVHEISKDVRIKVTFLVTTNRFFETDVKVLTPKSGLVLPGQPKKDMANHGNDHGNSYSYALLWRSSPHPPDLCSIEVVKEDLETIQMLRTCGA